MKICVCLRVAIVHQINPPLTSSILSFGAGSKFEKWPYNGTGGLPCLSPLYVEHQHKMRYVCVILTFLESFVKNAGNGCLQTHSYIYSTLHYIQSEGHMHLLFHCVLGVLNTKVQIGSCRITSNGGNPKFFCCSKKILVFTGRFSSCIRSIRWYKTWVIGHFGLWVKAVSLCLHFLKF